MSTAAVSTSQYLILVQPDLTMILPLLPLTSMIAVPSVQFIAVALLLRSGWPGPLVMTLPATFGGREAGFNLMQARPRVIRPIAAIA